MHWLSVLASDQKNVTASKSHWVLGSLCWLHTRRMQLGARVIEYLALCAGFIPEECNCEQESLSPLIFLFFNAWLVARYHYPQCVGRKEDTWHLRTDLTIRAEVFCHCCQPHKRRRFMVECNGCVGWYYRTCDAVPKQVQKNVHFFCSSCSDHWKGMKFFFFLSTEILWKTNSFIHVVYSPVDQCRPYIRAVTASIFLQFLFHFIFHIMLFFCSNVFKESSLFHELQDRPRWDVLKLSS